MKTIIKDLSEEDTKLLKNQRKMMQIGALITAIIFFSLVFYLYKVFFILQEHWEKNVFQTVVSPMIGFILVYVVYSLIQTQKDIKLGKKEILIGVLTKKEIIYKSLNSSRIRGNGDDGSYFFYFEERKIRINHNDNKNYYDKAEIGQTVAIERTINSKNILKVEVLKENE